MIKNHYLTFKNFARLFLSLASFAIYSPCFAEQTNDYHQINYDNYQHKNWNLSDKDSFLESTYLLDLRQGSTLSSKVSQLRGQGYETAYGDKISFDKWYSTNWTDARIVFMTQLTKSTGLVWGLSNGERGQKYIIEPGLTIGFIHQEILSKNSTLTFYGTTVFGGRLKEKTCSADYGEIGGVQTVNCRLAASTLQPAETLQYLMNEKPKQDMLISVKWTYRF